MSRSDDAKEAVATWARGTDDPAAALAVMRQVLDEAEETHREALRNLGEGCDWGEAFRLLGRAWGQVSVLGHGALELASRALEAFDESTEYGADPLWGCDCHGASPCPSAAPWPHLAAPVPPSRCEPEPVEPVGPTCDCSWCSMGPMGDEDEGGTFRRGEVEAL